MALMQLPVFPLKRVQLSLYSRDNQSGSLQNDSEHFHGTLVRKRTVLRDVCIGHCKHFSAFPISYGLSLRINYRSCINK